MDLHIAGERALVLGGTKGLGFSCAAALAGEGADKHVYDPLVLPTGIRPTGDPVLHARSAAYGISFRIRVSK